MSSEGVGRRARKAHDTFVQSLAQPPPQVRAHFHRLSYMWSDLALIGEDPTAWDGFNLKDPEKWFDDKELSRGAGPFEERQKMLDNILVLLEGDVDFEAIHDILATAKLERHQATREGKVIDYNRYIREPKRRQIDRTLRMSRVSGTSIRHSQVSRPMASSSWQDYCGA